MKTDDVIRVFRFIEYVGPRSVIEPIIEKSIHGTKQFGLSTIRAATVGTYPEILEITGEEKDDE